MNFFKKPYPLRRYSEPIYVKGYLTIPYEDKEFPMDVQTVTNDTMTTQPGKKSLQKLKVFCDFPLLVANDKVQQAADRIYFQEKWFECKASRLSENTILKHYTAEFIELSEGDKSPVIEKEGVHDEFESSES